MCCRDFPWADCVDTIYVCVTGMRCGGLIDVLLSFKQVCVGVGVVLMALACCDVMCCRDYRLPDCVDTTCVLVTGMRCGDPVDVLLVLL